MTIQQVTRSRGCRLASRHRTPFQLLGAAAVWLSQWLRSMADHYAAAMLYDRLSRLSDAQLDRRGLNRSRLAHDLIRMREAATAARTTSTRVDAGRAATGASRARRA